MPKSHPPHLQFETTRHGKAVWYVRRDHGPRVRITAEYDSKDFWAQYTAALEGAPVPSKMAKPNTLRWALDLYRKSPEWASLSNATRRQRENIFERIIETAGNARLADIDQEAVRDGRARRAN